MALFSLTNVLVYPNPNPQRHHNPTYHNDAEFGYSDDGVGIGGLNLPICTTPWVFWVSWV